MEIGGKAAGGGTELAGSVWVLKGIDNPAGMGSIGAGGMPEGSPMVSKKEESQGTGQKKRVSRRLDQSRFSAERIGENVRKARGLGRKAERDTDPRYMGLLSFTLEEVREGTTKRTRAPWSCCRRFRKLATHASCDTTNAA